MPAVLSMPAHKALELIGQNMQHQYEKTVDDVKKLCIQLLSRHYSSGAKCE